MLKFENKFWKNLAITSLSLFFALIIFLATDMYTNVKEINVTVAKLETKIDIIIDDKYKIDEIQSITLNIDEIQSITLNNEKRISIIENNK